MSLFLTAIQQLSKALRKEHRRVDLSTYDQIEEDFGFVM
jgi:hypothetical protein